jgi:hypothetical protein
MLGSRTGADGRQRWIRAVDLRPASSSQTSLFVVIHRSSQLQSLRERTLNNSGTSLLSLGLGEGHSTTDTYIDNLILGQAWLEPQLSDPHQE